MYAEKIDDMIMSARKNREKETVLVYQAVKNEFLKFKTAKNAKNLDDSAEIQIIRKMLKERQESAEIYTKNDRADLAEKEAFEANVLKCLLPAEPTDEDYEKAFNEFIATLGDVKFDKSQMGNCIKFIKSKVTGADGKKCSQLVQQKLNQ